MCVCVCSSLSQWVHACDVLELPSQQREQLDAFIDQLYKDIDKGHFSCRLPPVYRARPLTHWSVYLRWLNPSLRLTSGSSSTAETETHILPLRRPSICVKYDCFVQKCKINQSDERLSHFFSFAETGDFLNCEGSGLFLLQSSCENRLYSYLARLCLHSCDILIFTRKLTLSCENQVSLTNEACLLAPQNETWRFMRVFCVAQVTTAAFPMQRRLSPTTTSSFTSPPSATSAPERSEEHVR